MSRLFVPVKGQYVAPTEELALAAAADFAAGIENGAAHQKIVRFNLRPVATYARQIMAVRPRRRESRSPRAAGAVARIAAASSGHSPGRPRSADEDEPPLARRSHQKIAEASGFDHVGGVVAVELERLRRLS